MKPTKFFLPLAASLLLASCGGGNASSSSHATGLSSSEQSHATGLSSSEESHATGHSSSEESHATGLSSSEQSHDTGLSSSEQKGHPYITEPVTIQLMSGFNDTYQQAINNIIAEFNVLEPNVTVVNFKETGSYDMVREKVIANIATGDHPDMFVGYPDSVQMVLDYGVGADMTPYMTDPDYGWGEEDIEDIFPAYLEEGQVYTYPGSYSLPMCKSTEALYYNKDVLIGMDLHEIDATINGGQAIGEDYISNLTWEEMFDHLFPAIIEYNDSLPAEEKILTGEGVDGVYPLLGYDSDANLFITLAEQYGYGYTSVDEYGDASLEFVNDGMKNLMRTFHQAYQNGYIITGGSYSGSSYTSGLFTENSMLFCIGSTAGATHQYSPDFETGVTLIPHAAGHDCRVISQGPSLGFLSHKKDGVEDTQRELASWLFYRFFTSPENNSYWARTCDYLPIRFSVAEDAEYIKYCNPIGKTEGNLVKALTASYGSNEVGNYLYNSPVFTGSAEARNQVEALTSRCLMSENLEAEIDDLFQQAYENTLKKMA